MFAVCPPPLMSLIAPSVGGSVPARLDSIKTPPTDRFSTSFAVTMYAPAEPPAVGWPDVAMPLPLVATVDSP